MCTAQDTGTEHSVLRESGNQAFLPGGHSRNHNWLKQLLLTERQTPQAVVAASVFNGIKGAGEYVAINLSTCLG